MSRIPLQTAEHADAALKVTGVDLVISKCSCREWTGFTWLKRFRGRGGEQGGASCLHGARRGGRPACRAHRRRGRYLASTSTPRGDAGSGQHSPRRGRAMPIAPDRARPRSPRPLGAASAAMISGRDDSTCRSASTRSEYSSPKWAPCSARTDRRTRGSPRGRHLSPNEIEVTIRDLRAMLEPAATSGKTPHRARPGLARGSP